MNKIIVLLAAMIFSFTGFSQETDSLIATESDKGYEIYEDEEVEIVTDEVVKEAESDTTNIILGKKEISIIEKNGETSLNIKDIEQNDSIDSDEEFSREDLCEDLDDDDSDGDKKSKSKKFKGHWSGIEFGLNNYMDADNSMSRTTDNEFMDLNTARSWNINFNFAQYSFPIITDRAGFVTGMGLEWSNYHFSNNNTIEKDENSRSIQALDLSFEPVKNRLQTTYLTVPLLLECQLLPGKRKKRLYLAGGVIGGIKIGSHTKIKHYDADNKEKEKIRDDYYLSPLRYGLTGRIGYKMVKLYANYYLTPLFLKNKGPELYPVAVGLSMTF